MVSRNKLTLFLLKVLLPTLILFLCPLKYVDISFGAVAGSQRNSSDKLEVAVPTRKVRVGLYENKPKVFTGEDGKPSGIFIDILEHIARKEKWELIFVPSTWSKCLIALEENKIDLMPDVAFSPERDEKMDFNEEFVLESWSQLYARKGAPIEKLSDLDGRKIALLKGSIQQTALHQMMEGFGYKVTFIPTDSYDEAFTLAAEGFVDAGVSNHFFGNYYYREYGLVKTSIVFYAVPLYFATTRGRNPEMLKTIDRYLKSMKSEPKSAYYKALGQWMERPPEVVVPRYLLYIIGAIGVFLALAFVMILVLRRQVKARTRNLVQADKSLRRSEEKHRNLFETMVQGVVYQDAEGVIISANPAAERILGLSFSKMKGLKSTDQRWRALREDGSPFPGEQHPSMVALQTGREVSNEIMGIYNSEKDEIRWILIDAIPRYTQNATKPDQAFTIFADITDLKRAQEEIRNQHKELEQVFDTLPDALIYIDIEKRIARVNPAFVKIFGYKQEDIIGKQVDLLFAHTGHPEEEIPKWYNLIFSQSHKPYVISYQRAGGETFRGETVGSPIIDSRGKVLGILALVRDVTERDRLESQLQQAQKMQSIGRLAGGVAHDFNNMLSVILGYADLALRDTSDDHPNRESLNQIIRAGNRARDMTRQLLAFGSKQVLDVCPIDANNVVVGFEHLLNRVIGEDVALELSLNPEPCPVLADKGQLEQVFMNLAINARDAMPDGGILGISTALTILDESYTADKPEVTPGEYVMISINDTGCGMDKDTQNHIFDPFFTTKGREEGTGLGLATSYGIIKQHGGSIWAYSEPGKGTTFKIYLPVHKDSVVTKKKCFPESPTLKGWETILLVEDNEDVRNLSHDILVRQGYTVLSANNGENALKILENHDGPLHLLLTDVIMPGMSGRELFNRISQRFPGMKVLYMSGYADEIIVHRGILDEGIHFIQKPFSVQTLATNVRTVLNER